MQGVVDFLQDKGVSIDPFDNDNYNPVDVDTSVDDLEDNWVFPALYKDDSHGNSMKWQIGFNDTTKKLLTVVGRVGGAMQIFPVDVFPSKVSKSFQAKAFKEAKTKFENKMRESYKYDSGYTTVEIPAVMLAKKYVPPTEKSEGNITHFPVAAQAKFDGIRNIVYINTAGETIMLTRKMNRRAYFDAIREESTRLLEFLPEGSILDGEMFSDKVEFQTIASIGASELEQHKDEDKLDYYVFDIFHPSTVWRKGIKVEQDLADDGVYMRSSGYVVEHYTEAKDYFELRDSLLPDGECRPVRDIMTVPYWTLEVRLKLMANAFECYRQTHGEYPQHIKLTKTYIIKSREEIYKIFNEFKAMKLEGAMIRHFARGSADPAKSLYRPGRSDNLLKVKDVMSTEVIITGVTSGRGKAKELAILIYREPDTGITGTMIPAMDHEARRHYLKHPEELIGKVYTVNFQNRTRDGRMRFPIGIGIRSE